MTRNAPRRSIGHVVPITALAHWHDVIGVELPAMAHTAAVHACPVASRQHRPPPRLVGDWAIPTGCRVGPTALVSLGAW